MRNPQGLSVPLFLDRDRPASLQEQLAGQLRWAIDSGQLVAGTRMPSTRTMAGVLQISRGVALAAYEVLFAAGYIVSRHGSGTYVATGRSHESRVAARPENDARAVLDLSPDRASPEAFPLAAWRAAWRRASHHTPPTEPVPALGLPELRDAVAAHLRDTRGLLLEHHDVVITAGFEEVLPLLLQALGRSSAVVGLEDPALPHIRSALARHATVVPIGSDGSGAQPGQIPPSCDLVVVTPERNYLLGSRMSMERRHALAAWALEHEDGLVVEPAFDGVYNPRVSPRPSILAVGDPASTLMVGTFCDLLTPTLRLAYLIVPRHLTAAIEAAITSGPSFVCQLAAAHLFTSGSVARRVDRLSAVYGAKRALVRQALEAYADTRLLGIETGSTVTLLLPDEVAADDVVTTLASRNVRVAGLGRYYHPQSVPKNGLVIGYGHLDEITLHRALRVITQTLDGYGLARRRRAAAYGKTVA